MSCNRSRSGPGGVARTVSVSRLAERRPDCTNCRHGSLTENGSTAGLDVLGIASSTAPA